VGHLRGWRLLPVIVKTCDDLRQEQCAAQLIAQMHQILLSGGCQSWLRPYDIIALSDDAGLIEAIPDTVSLDALKKKDKHYTTLCDFYERFFGLEGTPAYRKARDNFVRSLAGYSIVCYILNLKDRHNGNILLDAKGHLIHIDYGFLLGKTPGGNIGFEKAPFKLTAEFVELMDGPRSRTFMRFRELCVKTFLELRRNHNRIVLLLEMLSHGNEHLPFFAGNPKRVIGELRKRFRLDLNDRDAAEFVHTLIETSAGNWTTTCYDRYQRCCVGIF
jgi:phosphatidylinositol 4-kinase